MTTPTPPRPIEDMTRAEIAEWFDRIHTPEYNAEVAAVIAAKQAAAGIEPPALPPIDARPTSAVSVRLPDEDIAALDRLAAGVEGGRSKLIRFAVSHLLAEIKESDAKIAARDAAVLARRKHRDAA
jgi:Arc/MetJ-type ribon-helix-helix transcriptional regulator